MGLGYSPFSGFGGMLFSSLMMASPSFGPPPPRVNITRVPRAPSAPSAPRPPPPPASSGPNEIIVISDSEDEEGTPAAPSRSGPPVPAPAGPFVVDEDEDEEEEDYDEEDEEDDDDGEICHTYGCPYHDPYLRYSMPWGDDSSDDSDY